MRSFTAFLVGAITGAAALLAVQRLQEEYERGESSDLSDRLDSRLQELEDRLAGEEASA